MCGFSGVFNRNDKSSVLDSLSLIRHRGPDDEKVFEETEKLLFTLGACRLSLNDFDRGQQPLVSTDTNYVLAFNGEIYNHLELKKELMTFGYKFNTSSDTEVAMNSLIEWGTEALHRWRGMWSLVFVNKRDRRVLLARDHFGQKPLYYSLLKNELVVASELKPILHLSSSKPKIDYIALSQFLFFDYIPAPRTPYLGINKLLPGHYLEVDLDKISRAKSTKYFYLEDELGKNTMNYHEMRHELEKSVKLTLNCDYDIGISLSGGIDSAGLLAIAQQQGYAPGICSLYFKESSFDERKLISKTAEHFGVEFDSFEASKNKIYSTFHQIYSKLDEPLGDSSLLPSYWLAQLISKKFKAYLSGDGGDELFYGYDPFVAGKIKLIADKVPFGSSFIGLFSNVIQENHKNMSLKFKLERFNRATAYNVECWLPRWMSNTNIDFCNQLFGVSHNEGDIFEPFINCLGGDSKHVSPMEVLRRQFISVYLPNNVMMVRDRASMLNSIENRSPYLDIEFAKNALNQQNPGFKKIIFKKKYHLKKVLENKLPKHLYSSVKKKGFGAPVSELLVEMTADERKNFPVTLRAPFEKLLSKHKSGSENNKSILWNSIVLEKMGYL